MSRMHRVEIWAKPGFGDSHADGVCTQIRELGIETVTRVTVARLFCLAGELDDAAATTIADELLVDPVVETFHLGTSDDAGKHVIEVHLQPGVMDPVAKSAQGAMREMGFDVQSVQTGSRYELAGSVTDAERELIATRLLANAVIEDWFPGAHTPDEPAAHQYELRVIDVPICELDDAGLETLSTEGDLFLSLHEMHVIRDYYRQAGREPRDIELEMVAQTWSEHCGHKTFRSDIEVRNDAGELVETIPNLLKNTVFKATMDLDKSWCLNVFADNAGVIEFDEDNAVCFKVETHNHPSAIEPYGGSMTGIGGVVRDPMGTGLGAKPIANTDVFCFGDTTLPLADLPKGTLHPRRVMRGVVSGVRDYGTRMGIPTVNGAVYFDDRYVGNPLVFCGTVAMMPNDKALKQVPNDGDAIVVVGGRTGRDGIHGATFSSGEMTHEHETEFSHAVQIGNAITEKKVLDTILQARDAELFTCITDCGAGGLSYSVGEMGETCGAEVHLDRVPLKYAGLSYMEIWISEAQERMVLAVAPDKIDAALKVFADENVEATVIGQYGVRDDAGQPLLKLNYAGTQVGELGMAFLHDVPRPTKQALWDPKPQATPELPTDHTASEVLLKLLAAPNIASKEWVIRQYDHEVQGGSAIKPLVGVDGDGPGDAAVVRPLLDGKPSPKGVVISCGMNPVLGPLDPYQSALHAIDEALRNCVAVGGNLSRTAILDNFCWGNCNKPDRMGALVQSAKACYHAAMTYSTPFISGKDSLNNEFQTETGETIAIPNTLLISAISVIDDVMKCVTSDFKQAGNVVVLVGETRPELGGSHLLEALGVESGNDVPPVDCATNLQTMQALQGAIEAGLVRSCHDLSEGGLAVAAVEMAFSGGLGAELSLKDVPVSDAFPQGEKPEAFAAKLFGESAGRFLLEVRPENLGPLTLALANIAHAPIGMVVEEAALKIDEKIDVDLQAAKAAWQGTFDW